MDKVFFGSDILRFVIALFDKAAYGLLKEVYVLFFNIATAEIINGAFVAKFFARIQLIIGIFMMFQLALTVIKGIMNPNGFTDEKTGAGTLLSRIVVALILLTLLVPINIASPANEYEKQLNNNGLLFGTLYSLQNRILRQNTLGRLILGTNAENYTDIDADDDTMKSLNNAANRFSTTVLRTFLTFNTINDGDDPTKVENRVCQSIDDAIFTTYTSPDSSPSQLLDLVNEKCVPSIGTEEYVFELKIPIVDSIVGFVFVWLIIAMTFEVAVRAVKLVVLRLIAPIPIISYMDPKGGKDGAFTSWVKLLGSTYLGLFIKLSVIYFVMSIVNDMLTNGMIINGYGSKFLQGLTAIIIWIGLFIFAKEADKFIKQALGIKDNGAKFFGNFGQALGIGAAGLGAVSGGISGAAARFQNTDGNFGKKLAYGILGGVGGFFGGARGSFSDWWGSKDGDYKKIMAGNRARVVENYNKAANGSTPWGTFVAGAENNFGFQNKYDKLKKRADDFGAVGKGWKNYENVLETDKVDQDASVFAGLTTPSGAAWTGPRNVKDIKDYLERLKYSSANPELQEQAEKALKYAKAARTQQIAGLDASAIAAGDTKTQIERQYLDDIFKNGSQYSKEKIGGAFDTYGKDVASFFGVGAGLNADQVAGRFTSAKSTASDMGNKSEQILTSPEFHKAEGNAKQAAQNQKKNS